MLLEECVGEVGVSTAGMVDGVERCKELCPEVLFLDYYLDEEVVPGGQVGKSSLSAGRRASIDILRDLTDDRNNVPAVILMSSRQISDSGEFRVQAGDGQIMALRFGPLQKCHLQNEGESISIDDIAADVLLDTVQGFRFGQAMQKALRQWEDGASRGLKAFVKEIGSLQTKDFAYLLRFRLREERESLSAYLGWLFSECLKGEIDRCVRWDDASFRDLDKDERSEEGFEGAFRGPSDMIAEFFHRVRVDDGYKNRRYLDARDVYRMGDLYVRVDDSVIHVVTNPECDLVDRNGMRLKSILVMRGVLQHFGTLGSAADHFVIYSDTPYSIRWDPMDLQTFDVEGEGSLLNTSVFEFVGRLRPLYAQEVQRRMLANLSRVGLRVAPAFALSATSSVWLRDPREECYEEIEMDAPRYATLIPSRDGRGVGHRVILGRLFVWELIDKIGDLKASQVMAKGRKAVNKVRKGIGGEELQKGFLREGAKVGTRKVLGIQVEVGNGPVQSSDAWAQIVLTVGQ